MGQIIINGLVRFNTLDGTLLSLDNSMDMVTLNHVNSDLLLLLIKHNGVPLSRETILNELWEKRGLSSSSNNLNSYISLLRKALVRCGCEGLISTIPKYGFLFEAEIVFDDAALSPQPKKVESETLAHLPGNKIINSVTHSFGHGKLKIVLAMLALLLMVFSPDIYDYLRLKSIRTKLFNIEQCQFYLADEKTKRQDTTSTVNTIKSMAEKVNMDCKHTANVYFFSDTYRDASGRVSRENLLAYCPYTGNAACENFFKVEYEK